ncbi:hypothetical protein D9615_000370 [Tricholomella constricta]|uniref:RING-type domain-containing protein n=1 Tax=Tricholomella constricta TaxID=117010 RepID=A0A8H5MBE6_9AGAR|nr:hypothetical protein D9615_000370 [Tricholomella constricta]
MDVPNDVCNRISTLIDSLPALTAQDLPDIEDTCPICLTSFSSIFLDADPETGVTKLVACNHIFCRKESSHTVDPESGGAQSTLDRFELLTFSQHGNCPTCRHTFLDIRPPSESDEESSDGGEYIPDERDEEFEDEDDGFIDTDGFSDAVDYLAEDMETDAATEWEDGETDVDVDMVDTVDEMDDESVWGLTDGETSYNLERADDVALESEDGGVNAAMETGVTLSVHDHDGTDGDVLNESGQEEK